MAKTAVGLRRLGEVDAADRAVGDAGLQARPQPRRHRVRLPSITQIQVSVEEREQLRGDEPHLRCELHLGLAQADESVGGVGVEHDDRLRAERAVLGAAKGQDVDTGVGGEGPQRQVKRRSGVGQPCAVHEDAHPALVRVVGDRAHFVGCVDGAELAGLREVDDERLRPVLVVPAPGLLGDQVGRELAVGRADREQLEAGDLLRCSALVGVDVGGLRADDRAPAGQHRRQADDVGAGAVEHRVGLGILAEVPCADLLQACTVGIFAVADLVAAVGGGDRVEHLGVHTGVVVGGEAADRGVVKGGHDVRI